MVGILCGRGGMGRIVPPHTLVVCTDDETEVFLLEHSLLDSREDGEDNAPIEGAGVLNVEVDFAKIAFAPSLFVELGGTEDAIAVRYFVRLVVRTGWGNVCDLCCVCHLLSRVMRAVSLGLS